MSDQIEQAGQPALVYFDGEMSAFLRDICDFLSLSIDGETVNIDVSGKCDSNEKSIIEHRLCEALHLHVYPELAVNIFDKQDRLNRREKSRKELEDEIRESVGQLIESSLIHLPSVRLQFGFLEKIGRLMGYTFPGILILKMCADSDSIPEVKKVVKPIAKDQGVKLNIQGTNLLQMIQDEQAIEQRVHG